MGKNDDKAASAGDIITTITQTPAEPAVPTLTSDTPSSTPTVSAPASQGATAGAGQVGKPKKNPDYVAGHGGRYRALGGGKRVEA